MSGNPTTRPLVGMRSVLHRPVLSGAESKETASTGTNGANPSLDRASRLGSTIGPGGVKSLGRDLLR